MNDFKDFCVALTDRKLTPTAIKVALTVGSILFMINHGSALVEGKMTKQRWFSGLLTYCVPYCVNIHGQYISKKKSLKENKNLSNGSKNLLIK
jgi:hypothetical protein